MKRAIVLASLAAACATSAPHREEHTAACAAQSFLQDNGYLGARIDGTVSLNESETARFVRSDGSIDWARLSAARNHTFDDRLIGARRDGTGYLAIYQMEPGVRRCVQVSGDYTMMHLQEAPCQATPTYAVSERSLQCFRLSID